MATHTHSPAPPAGLTQFLREHRDAITERWSKQVMTLFQRKGVGYASSQKALEEGLANFMTFLLDHIDRGIELAERQHMPEAQAEDGMTFSFADVLEVQSQLRAAVDAVLEESFADTPDRLERMRQAIGRAVDETTLETASLYYQMSEHQLQESRRETQQVAAICRMTTAIISGLDLGELCRAMASELPSLFRFRQARISILADAGKSMRQAWAAPAPQEHTGTRTIALEAGSSYAWVMEHRAPVLVKDLADADAFFDHDDERRIGMRSRVLLPIAVRDQSLGVLDLVHDEPDVYSDRDLPILSQIAGQLGVAIDCMRLLSSDRKRMAQLRVVSEVAKKVNTASLSELLRHTAQTIQESFQFYHVGILDVDRETNEVVLMASAGARDEMTHDGYRQPLGTGMVGWVAAHGQKLVANDVTQEPRRIIAFPWEHHAGSEMCVPIHARGQVVGVINIESAEVGAFDADDERAMETIAEEIAAAIEWTRLCEEREKAERLAAEARERLDQIAQALSLGIAATDLDGLVTHWGGGSEGLTGFSAEEMVGKRKPDELAASVYDLPLVLDTCRSKGQADAEVLVETKDGRRIWVRQVWTRLGGAEGEHVGYACCMEDVTQRREMEEALRQERDKLNNLVDVMGAGLCIIDSNRRMTWCNRTLVEWMETDEESVLKTTCCRLFKHRDSKCEPCGFDIVCRTGRPYSTEQLVMSSDGATRYFQHVYAPLRDESGAISSVIKLTQDVTQNALRVQQVSFLYQLGQEMQGTLDLERLLYLLLTCVTAGQHGLGFNRALLFMLNPEERVLEGRMAVGAIEEAEAVRAWQEIEAKHLTLREMAARYQREQHRTTPLQQLLEQTRFALDDDSFLAASVRNRRAVVINSVDEAGDSAKPFLHRIGGSQFVCVPLVAKDRPIGALLADNRFNRREIEQDDVRLLAMFATQAGLAIDTANAYQQLEEQMRQLDEAQQSLVRAERLAVVGELAAHVAHEIRNPLVTIGGFARNILKQDDLSERVQRSTSIIVQEVERLERILKSVMDFTKPSQPVKQVLELNPLVQEVADELFPIAEAEGLSMVLDLSPDVGELPIDADQIKQVLINIVKNAIEAVALAHEDTPPEARPALEPLHIHTWLDGECAVVSVQDTGVGMTPGVLENIFDPFYTVKIDGTGLGLAVSQKIVEDHGGSIQVKSEQGVGATFEVRLPLVDDSQAIPDPRAVLDRVHS